MLQHLLCDVEANHVEIPVHQERNTEHIVRQLNVVELASQASRIIVILNLLRNLSSIDGFYKHSIK